MSASLIIKGFYINYFARCTDIGVVVRAVINRRQKSIVEINPCDFDVPYSVEPEDAANFGHAILGMLKLDPSKEVYSQLNDNDSLGIIYEKDACMLVIYRDNEGCETTSPVVSRCVSATIIKRFAERLIAAAAHAELLAKENAAYGEGGSAK